MNHVLENERVQVGRLRDCGCRGALEMLLLEFASFRVLVTENEVNLRKKE